MPLDLHRLLNERRGEKYGLHERFLNAQMVRVLKTIGYDVDFVSAEGPYLTDAAGARYLDLLSGFGVFAIGRNHPAVIDVLKQVLDARLPNLVQMDVSLLAGILAERLLAFTPGMDRAFFCSTGSEAVESAVKFAHAATGRGKIVYCSNGFHGLTMGALSLNGSEVFRKGFEPLLPDCVQVPFNDLPALGLHCAATMSPASSSSDRAGVYMPAATICRGRWLYAEMHALHRRRDPDQHGRTGKFWPANIGVDPTWCCCRSRSALRPVGALLTKQWIFSKLFDRMDRAMVPARPSARMTWAWQRRSRLGRDRGRKLVRGRPRRRHPRTSPSATSTNS
jgi:ornithine--oxo-acid transaminase